MMYRRITLILTLMCLSALSRADLLDNEQNKLDLYQQSFENRQSELEEIENELFGYENKLKEARAELEKATAEQTVAEKANTEARIALAGATTQDNERAARLAEHSLAMAERGVRTRTKRLDWVEAKIAELSKSKAQVAQQLATSKERVASQEKRIEQVKAQAAVDVQKRAEAEKSRQLAEQKAQQQKAQQKTQQAAAVVQPKAAEAAPVIATQPVAQAEESAVDTTELDQEALSYVRKEMKRLEDLLDGGVGRPLYRSLILQGAHLSPQKLEFVGQNQYRVDAVVKSGKQTFSVGKFNFNRTIPAADNGKEYVFIFDSKRPSSPRLVVFKKSLLDLL